MSGPWASCLPNRLYPEMDTGGDLCGQALATAEFLKTCRLQGGPSIIFLLGESLPRVWTGLPHSLTDVGSLRGPISTSQESKSCSPHHPSLYITLLPHPPARYKWLS